MAAIKNSLNHDSSDLHDEHDLKKTGQQFNPKNQGTGKWEIPGDWSNKRFDKICDVVRGGSPRPAGDPRFFNGSFMPWLTVASLTNVPDSQVEVIQTEGYLTEDGAKLSRQLEKGTLILSNSGATLGVAKVLGIRCCANDGIAAFINWKDNEVDRLYAYYFLNTKTKYLRDVVAPGNGQPNLNTELIGIEHIQFPPLPEQRAIAQALSTWDTAVHKTEQLITQKELRKKWLMQNLLTGKMRIRNDELGMRNDEWKPIRIGDTFKFIKSYSISRDGLQYESKGSIFCIHYGDIHAKYNSSFLNFNIQKNIPLLIDEKIAIDESNYLQEGDIIMADASEDYEGVGAAVEIKNLNGKKAIGGLHTLVLRANKQTISPFFAAYFFASETVRNTLRKYATGTSVYSVTKTQIHNLSFIIPNSLNEQTAIAQVLQSADKEISLLKAKAEKLREQKKGLMQVLLTGKKRLKN